MNESAMVTVYSSRDQAVQDICTDLKNAETTQIRIIGISLNDFIGVSPNEALRDAWRHIVNASRGQPNPQEETPPKVRKFGQDSDYRFQSVMERDSARQKGKTGIAISLDGSQLRTDVEPTHNENVTACFRHSITVEPKQRRLDCRFYQLAATGISSVGLRCLLRSALSLLACAGSQDINTNLQVSPTAAEYASSVPDTRRYEASL